MNIILGILNEIWIILNASSLYILTGFIVAGFMYVYVTSDNVIRYFGGGKTKSVIMASLIGIPLPLCSCGVIPAAATLKKKGAGSGATVSFLISTPESGVTSIALTYALMDLTMTIARPVAAFITAFIAGILENIIGRNNDSNNYNIDKSCHIDGCCNGEDCTPEEHARHHTIFEKLRVGMRFAFGELIDDIAKWFLVGLVLAGVISYFIPANLVTEYLGSSFTSKIVMLLVGVPIYICATASTPIAAALILKGMSPGTALVFLMAGPATNIASIGVITKIIGKRGTTIYLFSISICSILLGVLLDYFYLYFDITPNAKHGSLHIANTNIYSMLATFAFLFLIARSYYKKFKLNRINSNKVSCCKESSVENNEKSCCEKH